MGEAVRGLPARAVRDLADQLGSRLILVWAGLSIGVAFVATPAKFMAPSLSLPVALDVGRQTFRVYNRIELALVAALIALALAARAPRGRYLAIAVPAAVVLVQALWLIPALDARVAMILAGARVLPDSMLHAGDIAAETLKVLWLLGFGLAARPFTRGAFAR
jgi:hypothetical protein